MEDVAPTVAPILYYIYPPSLGLCIYVMDSQFPASQASPYTISQGSRKRARTRSMEIVETLPTQAVRQITRFSGTGRKRRATSKIHSFKRTYDAGTFLSTDGVNPTLVAWNFSMNDMPGYTELTSLFDFYKLTGVLVRVMPYKQTDSNSVGSTNNSFNPPIFYAVDVSDNTNPASVAALLEYNDHKIANVWTGFKCYLKPKFSDSTSAIRDGWVACDNPSLNWYGLKIAIPAAGAATSFYVTWTYYVKCKDPK